MIDEKIIKIIQNMQPKIQSFANCCDKEIKDHICKISSHRTWYN